MQRSFNIGAYAPPGMASDPEVSSAAFSLDGSRFAIVVEDNSGFTDLERGGHGVEVRHSETTTLLRSIRIEEAWGGDARSVALSRNGSSVFVELSTGEIRQFDVATGEHLNNFLGGAPHALSPDDGLLITKRSSQSTALSDPATGELIMGWTANGPYEFSHDSRRLLIHNTIFEIGGAREISLGSLLGALAGQSPAEPGMDHNSDGIVDAADVVAAQEPVTTPTRLLAE